MSPGFSHWYRCTGGLGLRFRSRPSPGAFIALPTVDSGAPTAFAIRLRS
jgi:hypothetical protein